MWDAVLLERAFPATHRGQRSILATQNPLALGLYFRAGVEFRGLSFDFEGVPEQRDIETGVSLEPSDLVDELAAIDREVMGFDRRVDLEFLAGDRTLYLARRDSAAVGYAFGSEGPYVGPAATRLAADLPDVVTLLESEAAKAGAQHFRFTVPAVAVATVRRALESGYRIEPFYKVLLSNTADMSLDRYLMTQPSFIW